MATKKIWATVLVLLLAGAAAACGSDDKKKSAEGVEENRPVTVNGTALAKFPQEGDDPAVGKPLPEVTGQSFDGSAVAIGNDGKAKLIIFVAHWCPHCQKEIPLLADYLKKTPLPAGVDLYTVSTGVVSNRPNYPPSAWLKKEGWTAKTLADSKEQDAANAFGLSSYPFFVAADAQGNVVARTSGEISTGDFAALAGLALGNR